MFPRHQYAKLLEALNDTPVVLLTGARQVGKSTLAHRAANELAADYFTLDDATTLSAASTDPTQFIRNLPRPVVIDEIQRSPELLLAIKADVDRNRRAGTFLLTGSANVLMLPRVADSLAGRMEVLQLWPLSQGELHGVREDFPAAIFASDHRFQPSSLTEDELVGRLLAGGYPEAAQRNRLPRRQAWFDSYITTILQRDVQDLADIAGLNELPRLLQLLAARTSNLFNYSSTAREIGFPQSTLRRYLSLLQATYLVQLQPAWTSNFVKRIVRSPKILLNDTALSASLLDLDPRRLGGERKLLGQLLESFVVTELYKQLGWSTERARMYHFRSYSGAEVDVVLEHADGRLAGIEVKAASSVRSKDFRGMEALIEEVGERFERGIVLYLGDTVVPFSDRLLALPLPNLWSAQ
ncbi:MAG: ATP-binding protein [Trueperaceae bacterium]